MQHIPQFNIINKGGLAGDQLDSIHFTLRFAHNAEISGVADINERGCTSFTKCYLQRVKFARRPQAFNGCESTPASLSSEHDTARARHTIHQNGTGAALTCLAAMFDTIVTFLAQYRHQRFVGGTFKTFNNSINTQFELHFYFPSSDMPCETLVASSSTR